MLCVIKVSLWWFWNVSGHLPTNWCWNISICNGFCRFGCNFHVMVGWCCIHDEFEDWDFRGSWLPKTVHCSLFFVVICNDWAILGNFVLYFTITLTCGCLRSMFFTVKRYNPSPLDPMWACTKAELHALRESVELCRFHLYAKLKQRCYVRHT